MTGMAEKKPKMNKNLKVIEYIGSLYATIDGEKIWEMDRGTWEILKMCDGTKTVRELARELAKIIDSTEDEVMPALEKLLKEFEEHGFIEWV